MVTARRMGTNENIQTYGNGTRDFTSLPTWASATDNNLVSLEQTEVLECYADSATFDDQVDLSGATTSALYHRIIRPASGQKHDGTGGSGVKFVPTTTTIIGTFQFNESFISVQDIVASSNVATASSWPVFNFISGTGSNIIGCIVDNPLNSSGSTQGCLFSTSGIDQKAIDCLFDDASLWGILLRGHNTIAYNCTSVNNGNAGFLGATSEPTVKNCLADNNVTDFSNTFSAASVTNASSDATAPGTGSRINQTFTFVNAAADDYHLAAGDAGARNFGTDLSADATFKFDDDIDRERFNTWDIGFDDDDPLLSSGAGQGLLTLVGVGR